MADLAQQNLLALKNKSFEIKFDLANSNYQAIEKIGTGAYGVVCSAEHILTKKRVAIKKIPDIFEQLTIAKRTYREIKILKHFKHDNVIAIRDILKPLGENQSLRDVYIVLDLMETDMHRIIHSNQEITDEHVRYFLYQVLRGLKYIHSANVIHRDLKPSNLLVNENCDVKIGDFGMARGIFSDPDDYNPLMTQYVATRWYRAPELLMARLAYTGAVDMWSVGCIFAEMLGRTQIFPGKDYIHQMKLIIGIMGSPSPDFLRLIKASSIRKSIASWGVKKAVPLQKLYPKATSDAIDLLTTMLALNPESRVSVESALSHPFLKKYHDPTDEPCCVPAFDFNFERKDMSPQELKAAITREIQDYHPVYEKPKIAFDFRPVPKSEINHHKPSPKKSPGTKADKFVSSDKDCNFGLNAFLTQIRRSSDGGEGVGQENRHVLQRKPVEREFSGSGQPLSFLSANSPKSEFKVPVGLPNSKQNRTQLKQEAESVEMLSAHSDMKVDTDRHLEGDIEMLSAGKVTGVKVIGSTQVKAEGEPEVKVKEENEDKSLNAKEVLKAAILNAAQRKQKGESVNKSRSKTALQIQREREEKKRKKAEKAQERKKRQREKVKESKGISLSDEDKNLLQRWATMQQRPAKAPAASTATTSVSGLPGQRGSVPQQDHTAVCPVVAARSLPSVSQERPGVAVNGTSGSTFSRGEVVESSQEQGKGVGGGEANVFNQPHAHSLSSNQSTHINSTIPNGSVQQFSTLQHNNQISQNVSGKTGVTRELDTQPSESAVVDLTKPQPILERPEQNLDPKFSTAGNIYDYSLPSLSPLDTDMKSGTLDEILNQFVNEEPEEKLPPTYSEALEANKLYTTAPPDSVQNNTSTGSSTKHSFLPFQTYSPSEDSIKSVFSPEMALNQPSTSTAGNNRAEEGNLLSIITRQMMRSHMDDLTLTKTPKGTGGTGYGVGTDLESLMEVAAKDVTLDRSAPLSATESLIGDWLEVSGMKTLDSKEYEALERELGLQSPILNIQDLVPSPS